MFCFRDLKPDNVMTEEDGTPVVMDLGSAALARLEIKSAREATSLQVCSTFEAVSMQHLITTIECIVMLSQLYVSENTFISH